MVARKVNFFYSNNIYKNHFLVERQLFVLLRHKITLYRTTMKKLRIIKGTTTPKLYPHHGFLTGTFFLLTEPLNRKIMIKETVYLFHGHKPEQYFMFFAGLSHVPI